MTENSTATVTDIAPAEEVVEETPVRVCGKCGEPLADDAPARYRVHDACLATPALANLRKRVHAQGLELLKKNQHGKFERILESVADVTLSVWAEGEADAVISAGETNDETGQPGSNKFRTYVARAVALRVFETVDDPKAKKPAAKSA